MDADRIKSEIFQGHYRDMNKHIAAHDYKSARESAFLGAKFMYEMAKASEGEHRQSCIRLAEEMQENLLKIDKLIKGEERLRESHLALSATASSSSPATSSRDARSENKKPSPEQQVMRGGSSSQRGGDDDQRIFEAMPVPDISFDDVVGLHDVKAAVREKIIEPRLHPELYEKYKMESGGGILMYGPPGTGKTMIAKAIAHETNSEFFALRCSDLVNKWFGGTEQNIGALFDTARSKKNAVIFFDEFDSLGAGRDKNNSTVMRRVVPELLTQLQGVTEDNNKKGSSLLVLAATNVPWMLDTAFLRPGRFDERIYVGLPDEDARRGILERNLRGIPCKETIDLNLLVDSTNGYNCADIVQLVKKAKSFPLARERMGRKNEGLTMEDFAIALESCRSSVMKSDIEKMIKWQESNGIIRG